MKRILFALLALEGVALAACRIYDVDVYRNVNGRARGADGVTESFTCTADSLLWAELFVGAANSGGQYHFEIQTPEGQKLYERDTSAGPNINYRFVRADLVPEPGAPPLIKGKEYVLKVTCTAPGESLNWYADSTDPYKYGLFLDAPTGGQSQPLLWDLCARIEGVNRAVADAEFTVIGPPPVGITYAAAKEFADSMASCGVKRAGRVILPHDWIMGNAPEPHPAWYHLDSTVKALCEDSIEPIFSIVPRSCQEDWAAHAVRPVTNGTIRWYECSKSWFGFAFRPVLDSNDSVNSANPLARWVYESLHRYGVGGTFWSTVDVMPQFPIRYLGLEGEPNLEMPWPYFLFQGDGETLFKDTTYRRIESTLVDLHGADTLAACQEFRDTLVVRYCIVMDSVIDWFNKQHTTEPPTCLGTRYGLGGSSRTPDYLSGIRRGTCSGFGLRDNKHSWIPPEDRPVNPSPD